MLSLEGTTLGKGLKITRFTGVTPVGRTPPTRMHTRLRTQSGPRIRGEGVANKVVNAFRGRVRGARRGHIITTTTEGDVGGGWCAALPGLGRRGARGLSQVPIAFPEGPKECPGPNTRGRGEGIRTRVQPSVWSWTPPRGLRRALALTRRSLVLPLAVPPLKASKGVPTLAHVHCHSHGNSYTNGTHIGAHTQYYKHASSRVHTQTRTLILTNMHVHGHSKHTHRRTQLHMHTHIGVQPHIHSKNKTLPCALNPHVHVHIQTHLLLLPSSSS